MRAIYQEHGTKFIASVAHWATLSETLVQHNEHLRRFLEREGGNHLDLDRQLPRDDWSIHIDQIH